MIDTIDRYGDVLLSGLVTTIVVSLGGFVIANALGAIIALMRLSPAAPLRWIAGLYVDALRAVPLIAALLFGFYVLPMLFGLRLGAQATGTVVLGIAAAAYFAEIYRAGINTVPQGQREAALAQGMTPAVAMRRVVLPQAIRRMLPPLTSMTVTLVKDSSLVSILGVTDLIYQANAIAAVNLDPLPVVTLAGLLYAAIALPLTLASNRMHRRFVETA